MTVISLWKILDEAKCGVKVGANDLIQCHHSPHQELSKNWYDNKKICNSDPIRKPALAIDLSIWICEALTSPALVNGHTNPALYLSYTRAVKLLTMGIKLIVVIDGKRRVRRTEQVDCFKKRRSGSAFWNACRNCERMFSYLGVPVVKATSEAEALCALLNMRGVVDGVISNDGDCLLFGAKVLFTNFSIDALQNSEVVRYDSSNLAALVEDTEDQILESFSQKKIELSRLDLISFALLTGSDIAGNGLPKVGVRKAVRFLQKCKFDHPLTAESAAMEELASWEKTALFLHTSGCGIAPKEAPTKCCSTCSHPGTKRGHLKDGCETCGTAPGEPCFAFTESDRFRKNLRTKALALEPKFAPKMVVDAYMNPNENAIPLLLRDIQASVLKMEQPQLQELLSSELIIKGQCLISSRKFVLETLSSLLIRHDLFTITDKQAVRLDPQRLSTEIPRPIKIIRKLFKNKEECFEVTWKVQSTFTDDEGNGINGYDFTTTESAQLITKKYPNLVLAFNEAEAERQKQGDKETLKRKDFIESFMKVKQNEENGNHQECVALLPADGRAKKQRRIFFENQFARSKVQCEKINVSCHTTEEINNLMIPFSTLEHASSDDFDYSTIASGGSLSCVQDHDVETMKIFGMPKHDVVDRKPHDMTIEVITKQPKQNSNPRNAQNKSLISVAHMPPEYHESERDAGANQDKHTCVGIKNTFKEDAESGYCRRVENEIPTLNNCLTKLFQLKPLNREKGQHGMVHNACNCPQSLDDVKMCGVKSSIESNLEKVMKLQVCNPSLMCSKVSCKNDLEKDLEIVMNTPKRQKKSMSISSPQRLRLRLDPDEWMDKVTSQKGVSPLIDKDSSIVRRLIFEDATPSRTNVDKFIMPQLTPGQNHLVLCDMGMTIVVTPLLCQKV
jgi:XPG I-region/Chromatin organization modifier domain 2/XPG N-terminal domain